jgi:hypothetical protein
LAGTGRLEGFAHIFERLKLSGRIRKNNLQLRIVAKGELIPDYFAHANCWAKKSPLWLLGGLLLTLNDQRKKQEPTQHSG